MAIMIPGPEAMEDFNSSGGEKILYDKLCQLPDTYYIFHSARWNEVIRKEGFARRRQLNKYIEWREADFVVLYPPRGLLFIEVKDGEIKLDREKGWLQINRDTHESTMIDPLAQAEKSQFYISNLISLLYGKDNPYACNVGCAVWFTSADKSCVTGKLPMHYKEELILWASDMVNPLQIQQSLNRVFEYSGIKVPNPTEEMTKKIVDVIAPEFGVFASVTSTRAMKDAIFHKLTDEQSFLLDYLDEQDEAAIHGFAGTGKTCLAVQKAKQLAEDGETLLLCFNTFLKDNLKENPDNQKDHLTINNLPSLYVQKTGNRINFESISNKERDEMISDFLLGWKDNGLNYKHYIIDEGQDFCEDHLQLLHDIAKEQKGCFYVFYDRNQFSQGEEYPKWLDEIECRLVLNRNCRNTREIAVTSTRPVGILEEKIKTRYDTAVSVKPRLYMPKSKEELLDLLDEIINAYAKAKVPKDKIVILTVNSEESSIISKDDYILSPENQLSTTPVKGKVWFTTVRKFKGLEAEVIICIDVDESCFQVEAKQHAFYIGTSRAQTFLDIIALVPDNDALIRLGAAASGKQIASTMMAKAALNAALQVKITNDPTVKVQ